MKEKIRLIFFVTILFFTQLPVKETAAATFSRDISAKGAILMEQESGRVLYEKEAHTPMRIASITKIMTAILAIESGKLDDWVTVSSNAVGVEGSSIYLAKGEKIKLIDLVYGLMLRSGNDAAVAIAEYVGGSLEGFVHLMNEKRKELGMINTNFTNPHGLDTHEEHYSTAYDMAILTRYAMKNETFREISGTKAYRSVNKDNFHRLFHNKNRLLTQLYKYCTGGKTGFTKRARRTLVTTAMRDDMGLIAVTLDAPSDWNDHIQLYEWAFSNYELTPIVREGILQNVKDSYFKNKLYVQYSFQYPLTKEEKDKLTKRLILYKPPKDKRWEREGHPYPIGTIQLELDDEAIGIVPLKYLEEEEKPSFWKSIFH